MITEIAKLIVEFYEKEGVLPEVRFYRTANAGSIFLNVRLDYHGKAISHDFYIAGGELCEENFERSVMRTTYPKGEIELVVEKMLEELKAQED